VLYMLTKAYGPVSVFDSNLQPPPKKETQGG
jgi:hypothetical protein